MVDPMETKQLNIRLPLFLKLAVEQAARLAGVSIEAWVEQRINEGLEAEADQLLALTSSQHDYLTDLKSKQKYRNSQR